jgi:hypothetical protein
LISLINAIFLQKSTADKGFKEGIYFVGAFMADLAGRRSVLFPKIQREAGRYI